MESDGEVIICPVQNCSHCETGECHENEEGTMCYCDEDLVLAPDGVSCVNASTGQRHTYSLTLMHTHAHAHIHTQPLWYNNQR